MPVMKGTIRDRSFLLGALLVAGLTLAVFAPHLDNGFVYDDHPQIEENPWVTQGGSWIEPFRHHVWEHKEGELGSGLKYYRPLFLIANRVAYEAGSGSPRSFHLLSLLLHLISVGLMAVVLVLLGFERWLALAGAALIAVHPIVGESVYWAGSLSEQMLLIGFLGALAGLEMAVRNQGLGHRLWVIVATLSCMFALLSKETAVVIAPILTVKAIVSVSSERRQRLLNVGPLWAATVAFLWLRSTVIQSSGLGDVFPKFSSSLNRAWSALMWDLEHLFYPFPLSPMYELYGGESGSWSLLLGLLVVTFAVGIAVRLVRERPVSAFWLAWLVLPLLPRLLQLFFRHQTGIVVADRYLLLSLVPFCALAVLGASRLLARVGVPGVGRRLGWIVLVGAMMVGAVATSRYGEVFASDETFFGRALEVAPANPLALNGSATILMARKQFPEAIELLQKAVEIEPRRAKTHLNLGIALSSTGRLEEAAASYRMAIALDGGISGAYLLLGDTLRDLGDLEEAAKHWQLELAVTPSSVPALVNLGTYTYLEGDVLGAIRYWEEATVLAPDNLDLLFNLGKAYGELGQHERAATYLRRFLATADSSYSNQILQAERWLKDWGLGL